MKAVIASTDEDVAALLETVREMDQRASVCGRLHRLEAGNF